MNDQTDSHLLRAYAEHRSEPAFAELVRRHVDLVYSAALRMVCDSHLAEDVTQAVFVALAKNATQLTGRPVLSGWLHRTAQNIAAQTVRTDVRRRSREQEAVAMNELLAAESDASWEQIAPHLDAALGELSEPDRDALLLRYFERKSAREMAQTLGITDEAAQRRVTRAVERLREFLAKRGPSVGASGLVVVLSAKAVHAAPVGLAVTISTLAATTTATATTATLTQAIAMTTLQKALIAAALVIAVGASVYEARQASTLRTTNQTLEQKQSPLNEQIQRLQTEQSATAKQLALLKEENARLKSGQNAAELLKLRGQVGALRQQTAAAQATAPGSGLSKMMNDPAMKEYIHHAQLNLIKTRYTPLFQELKLTPEQSERFVQLLGDMFLKNTERFAAMPQGNISAAELVKASDSGKAEMETELRALIGDAGCARLKEYDQEIPARATMDLLNNQLGSSQLTEEQSARLFKLVRTEPFDLTHGIAGDFDKAFTGSPEEVDAYLQKIGESNQRVLQQAGQFLTADQLMALNTVLTNGVNARITQAAAFVPKH